MKCFFSGLYRFSCIYEISTTTHLILYTKYIQNIHKFYIHALTHSLLSCFSCFIFILFYHLYNLFYYSPKSILFVDTDTKCFYWCHLRFTIGNMVYYISYIEYYMWVKSIWIVIKCYYIISMPPKPFIISIQTKYMYCGVNNNLFYYYIQIHLATKLLFTTLIILLYTSFPTPTCNCCEILNFIMMSNKINSEWKHLRHFHIQTYKIHSHTHTFL